ncbi:MAG: short-chain dehydrogenase, partial [SAR86 cluster bacterium]
MSNPFNRELFNLDGRTAVVTGAGGGLGRVFAQALGAFGAKVFCTDIDLAGVEETAKSINQSGGIAEPLRVDAADESSIAALADAIEAAGGRCDLLV